MAGAVLFTCMMVFLANGVGENLLLCGHVPCAGVELNQLQVEDEPLRPHWICQHRHRVSGWISVCVRWKSMSWCCV